jgi:molecular chaperone GrpE (heat shock protein)
MEWERIRRQTKEKQEANSKEDKERLKQLIKQIREGVERMKESLIERCEDRASNLAADISNFEKETEHSIVEIRRYIVWKKYDANGCQKPGVVKLLL